MKLEKQLTIKWKNKSFDMLSKMFDYNITKKNWFFQRKQVEIWTIKHYWKIAEIIRYWKQCIYTRDL